MTPADPDLDALIVRALQGTAPAAERERLAAWVEASPRNAAHYAAVRRLWLLTEPGRAPSGTRLPAAVSRRLELRRVTGEWAVPPRARAASPARRWAAAAAAACALLAGGWWGLRAGDDRATVEAEYATGPTQTQVTELANGTVVRLAPRSRLRVLRVGRGGRGGARELALDGHAFFAVARREDAPLVVRTAHGRVRAGATRFDLAADPAAMRVLVVEGRVGVEAAGGRLSVRAGHAARAVGSSIVSDTVPDVWRELQWMRRFLVFRDTPLRHVAAELARAYDVRVEVPSDVGARVVTAWFDGESLDEVLAVICRATFTRYAAQDGTVRIVPATRPERGPLPSATAR